MATVPIQRRGAATLALLGAALAACPALAGEAERHAQILERLAPQDRPAYVQRLIEQQQARAGASLAADVNGPALTSFNSSTTYNVSNSKAPFKVNVKATDDLSGVKYLYFYARGPGGQVISTTLGSGFPATSVNLIGGFEGGTHRFLEPGAWKFYYGYGYDGAGNYTNFDEATLDALGNTGFTVVNNGGHDVVKPTLTGGKILTPTVSLSAVLPGTTDAPPYAKVKATVTDAGNTALSGVATITLYFCKVAEPYTCFYPSAFTYALGLPSASLNVGAQVSAANGQVTGTYELKAAYVDDRAGNSTSLQSTLFGGTTDFSTMFPEGTTIKIKP